MKIMARQNPFATLMAMDDATWQRHANPWSVWTRIPILTVTAFVLFIREALGVWLWPLLALIAVWTFVNPRAFPPPSTMDSWATRGVLGERFWLGRKALPIPRHHARWALGLSLASGACLIPLAWGLVVLDPWATAFGALGASAMKLWFVDRMAWLYQDMSQAGRAAEPGPRD